MHFELRFVFFYFQFGFWLKRNKLTKITILSTWITFSTRYRLWSWLWQNYLDKTVPANQKFSLMPDIASVWVRIYFSAQITSSPGCGEVNNIRVAAKYKKWYFATKVENLHRNNWAPTLAVSRVYITLGSILGIGIYNSLETIAFCCPRFFCSITFRFHPMCYL